MRVHEATTEKKGARKRYERTQAGTRTRRDPPPKHNFRVELKELIAIPNIATRLKVPTKIDKKMGLGPNKNAWCEFHRANGHYIRNCLASAHQLDELVKSDFVMDYLQGSQNDQALVIAGARGAYSRGGKHNLRRIFRRRMHCLPAKEVRTRGGRSTSRSYSRCLPHLHQGRPLGCHTP